MQSPIRSHWWYKCEAQYECEAQCKILIRRCVEYEVVDDRNVNSIQTQKQTRRMKKPIPRWIRSDTQTKMLPRQGWSYGVSTCTRWGRHLVHRKRCPRWLIFLKVNTCVCNQPKSSRTKAEELKPIWSLGEATADANVKLSANMKPNVDMKSMHANSKPQTHT